MSIFFKNDLDMQNIASYIRVEINSQTKFTIMTIKYDLCYTHNEYKNLPKWFKVHLCEYKFKVTSLFIYFF